MPLVKIYIRKGKSPEFLADVGNAVHEALVTEANVPADDRFQVFHELEADRLVAHPTYGGVLRSNDLIIIEVTFNFGRTVEIKKNLYAAIARRLGELLDVRPDDVMISLVEVPKENWSFGGGRMTYEP